MPNPCTTKMPASTAQSKFDGLDTPRINLSTSDDIRREMAKVYRETRVNKIMPSNGTKLIYMLASILKAYEATQIEKRLTNLEMMNMGQ